MMIGKTFTLFSRRPNGLRFMSTVIYNENGHPFTVLKVVPDSKLPKDLKPSEVSLKFLAAPINPADLNMVRGGYGVQPKFPAVGGNEGVAVVTGVGSSVSGISVNDRVIPNIECFGTWRNFAVTEAKNLLKVSAKIPVEYAATMGVNPCTAYRMLHDFVDLKADDVIVQNGADSSVGQAVIQLAALRGIKTINIIRSTEKYDEEVDHLKSIGGHIVVPEEYVATPAYKKLVSDLPAPKLGLNCIGGKSSTNVARALGKDATFVTYGGMSMQPVILPTSSLIFKNLHVRGFWMTKWVSQHPVSDRQKMLDIISRYIEEGKLRTWVVKHKFSEFHDAVAAVQNRTTTRKIVLTMEE